MDQFTSSLKMTSFEYMNHKNIPIPNHAKYPNPDLEVNSLMSNTLPLSFNSTPFNSLPPPNLQELNNLKKQLDDKTKQITNFRQIENQYNNLSTQFQDTNHNHQIQINQLLEQLEFYKQRTNNMKLQIDEYLHEINSCNSKYEQLYSQKEEISRNLRDKQSQYDDLLIQYQNKNKEFILLQGKVKNIENTHFDSLPQIQLSKRTIVENQIKDFQIDWQAKNLENKNSQQSQKYLIDRIPQIYNQNETKNIQIENQQLKQNVEQLMSQNQIKTKDENSIKDRMRIIILNTEIERLWCVIEDCEKRNQQQIQQLEHLSYQLNQFKDECQLWEQKKIHFQKEQMKRLQYEQDILLLQQQQDVQIQSQKELQNKNAMLMIEVERLNMIIRESDNNQSKNYFEIQSLRKELEQSQVEIQKQQNIVMQMEVEISNYQQESMLLNSDNDNLNMRITNLEEDMNIQIVELTQNFKCQNQILEEQLKKLELQKNDTDQINQNMKLELQKYKIILDGQCDKQNQKLQTNEKERFLLLQEIQNYQQQLQQNINENKKQKEDLIKERMKIIIFASEIDRLWSLIEDFTNNIKAYEEQQNLSNDKINSLSKSIQQFQNTISRYEQDKKQYQEKYQSIYQSQETKIKLLTRELERAQSSLQEEQLKEQDFEQKQKTYLQEVKELNSQIDLFQQEITILQKNGLELSDLEMKFQAERISWEAQKYQWKNQLQDNQQKILIQFKEIQRLNQIGEERQHEIEELRYKFENQKFFDDYEKLKQEFISLEQQLFEQEQINLKCKANSLALEKQNQLLDLQLQGKIKEIDEAYSLMNRQRKQSENVNKESENHRKTLSQLQFQNSNLDNQTQQYKENINKLYYENQNLLSQIQYLQNCLLERDQVVFTKNQELSEKIKEIDQLKIKFQQKINISTVQSSVFRCSSLSKQITQTEQENLVIAPLSNQRFKTNTIISRPPRQVMSQINKENNNQYE